MKEFIKENKLVSIGISLMIIICVVELIVMIYLTITPPPKTEHYPLCGTVVEINRENGKVMVEDFNGNLWTFEGCEDWLEGDICAMIISDEATPDTIYDDVIIQTRYCGWVK